MKPSSLLFALLLGALFGSAQANPALLTQYQQQAKQQNPAFSGFSAERGKALYYRESTASGKAMSCASCHTSDPRKPGKTPAFRTLEPFAPSITPARFSDVKKVEKWFLRNCDDVFKRECSPQEKGDLLSWILTVK